jgi:hypothetical protein
VGVEVVLTSDEDMFTMANTSGAGNMTFEEFVLSFGAQIEDPGLLAQFIL